MRAEDLYKGRRPKVSTQTLRQPSTQPGGRSPRTTLRGIGDVKDSHLNGKGDPYSVAHKGKK
jgi:hypothetical protein